jgi:uncharacterized protein
LIQRTGLLEQRPDRRLVGDIECRVFDLTVFAPRRRNETSRRAVPMNSIGSAAMGSRHGLSEVESFSESISDNVAYDVRSARISGAVQGRESLSRGLAPKVLEIRARWFPDVPAGVWSWCDPSLISNLLRRLLMTLRWNWLSVAASLLGSFGWCSDGLAQALPLPDKDVSSIYQRLLGQIARIPIVDMHAHPGYWDDPDVDAMAVATTDLDPLRTRASNPEWVAAAKALFDYPYSDFAPEHLRWLHQKDEELRTQWGKEYFSKILDRAGIQVSAANRVAMDYLENNPRFRFVFFVDPFMFPFDNQRLRINPDRDVYFPIQEKVLRRYLEQAGLSQVPADLRGYEAFMRRFLEHQREHGALALKFEAPYFRSLVNITDPPREQAEAIYARYHAGAAIPSADEYRVFQDYVFRYLIAQASPLHLQVHIHSAVGSGKYYHLAEGNAMNLENVLRDPRYKDNIFVLIHGGFPFERQSIWLAALPNVYLDSSEFNILVYPAEYARTLKQWFELFPEKVVFGSDAFPYSRDVAAPATYWLAVQTSRTAAAAALAEMVAEGEVTESRALEIARGYLHDNAARLFGIELLPAQQ